MDMDRDKDRQTEAERQHRNRDVERGSEATGDRDSDREEGKPLNLCFGVDLNRGDFITAVDGVSTFSMSLDDMRAAISGPRGSKVTLRCVCVCVCVCACVRASC